MGVQDLSQPPKDHKSTLSSRDNILIPLKYRVVDHLLNISQSSHIAFWMKEPLLSRFHLVLTSLFNFAGCQYSPCHKNQSMFTKCL